MDSKLKDNLNDALQLWQRFWGDDLVSFVVYGSAARGEWTQKRSDINTLMIVNASSYDRWEKAAELVQRKAKKGFATPLIFTEQYVRDSADVFPIEYLDIQLFHETMFGKDLFGDLTLEKDHLRMQAERELRGKWVQMREATLERGGDTTAMRNLLAISVPTWVAVFQALIHLDGEEVPADKRDVLRRGCEITGVDVDTFQLLMDVRRQKISPNRTRTWQILRATLQQLDSLMRYADKLDVER